MRPGTNHRNGSPPPPPKPRSRLAAISKSRSLTTHASRLSSRIRDDAAKPLGDGTNVRAPRQIEYSLPAPHDLETDALRDRPVHGHRQLQLPPRRKRDPA